MTCGLWQLNLVSPSLTCFARNVSDMEMTMETFLVSSFADLEQIMDMTSFKLCPIDWFVTECPKNRI